MKTEKNILIAFILNLCFSIFEFFGGLFTGSIAIISDSIHDLGDALSIGISFFLERGSKKKPNSKYTYGYIRYSVLGSLITTVILLVGSLLVIAGSIHRVINPIEVNYSGMVLIACIGVVVNFLAAYFTHGEGSLNQKSVNLHMLEDVLGWVVVLVGAILMNFTDISVIDPIMSIGVAMFILINTIKNLGSVMNLFMDKTPKNVDIDEIIEHLIEIENVIDVHHIHVRSIDGYSNYGTLHLVIDNLSEYKRVKDKAKEVLKELNVPHTTIEFELNDENCDDVECKVQYSEGEHHHHHHHQHQN